VAARLREAPRVAAPLDVVIHAGGEWRRCALLYPQTRSSCPDLIRASINLQKTLANKMDCRVKPGNDDLIVTAR